MKPALISGGIFLAVLAASLGQFFIEHPFETWGELFTPGLLFALLGHTGTVAVSYMLKSPGDALRSLRTRSNDAPNSRAHESRGGSLGI